MGGDGRGRDQHQCRLDAASLNDSGLPFLRLDAAVHRWRHADHWAWATWWIPLLVLFGIWKHGVRRVPLTYTPMLWSLVFPLGMYAVASLRLSLAADVPLLRTMSLVMVWVALAVWGATAIGLTAARGTVIGISPTRRCEPPSCKRSHPEHAELRLRDRRVRAPPKSTTPARGASRPAR